MEMSYKEKLLVEINALPEDLLPRFYRIIHTMRTELTHRAEATPTRGSLRGIWGNVKIDESHIFEAKKTLFPYDVKDEAR